MAEHSVTMHNRRNVQLAGIKKVITFDEDEVILEVIIWSQGIIPIVYSLFFIGIPLVVFLITLFKPDPGKAATEPIDL